MMELQLWHAVCGWLIVEVIKLIINKGTVQTVSLGQPHAKMIEELYTLHDTKDDAGKPLWYVDPSISRKQDKIIDRLAEMDAHMDDHALSKDIINTLKEITISQKETAIILSQLTMMVRDISYHTDK
jgi:hypothetical protein